MSNWVEVPDENGLSSDSLRGSHHFIQPHLVGSEDSRDALTGRPNPRDPLSRNEIRALENVGMLVDENGYEREPEPVVQTAPQPLMQPRVRSKDAAPAGNTDVDPFALPIPPMGGGVAKPHVDPPVNVPVDASNRPHLEDASGLPVIPPSEGSQVGVPIAPYGGSPVTQNDVNHEPPSPIPTEPSKAVESKEGA